jgi:hypothetical protein
LEGELKPRWYLRKKCGIVEVSAAEQGVPDFYFSDSVDIEATGKATKLTMLFSSIKEKHFKEFCKVKGQQPGSWDIYLPLVEISELKYMVRTGTSYSDETLQFRFDLFGGSARNCLDVGNYADVAPDICKTIRGALLSFFGKLTELDRDWAVRVLGQNVDKLFSISNNAEQLNRSVFQHVFVNSDNFGKTSTSFCTNFMKYLCGRILQGKERSLRDRIVALFGECGAGVMFESVAFDELINNLRARETYYMRNLTSRGKPYSLSVTHPIKQVLIRTVEDIGALKDGQIGVPVTGNFPLVDFVLKPNILFQITTAVKHNGAIDTLASIRKQLGGNSMQHKMVFVTLAENCNGFKLCDFSPSNIKQYVMCPTIATSEKVLGKRR